MKRRTRGSRPGHWKARKPIPEEQSRNKQANRWKKTKKRRQIASKSRARNFK